MAYRLSFCSALTEVPAAAWDALVSPNEPFARHAFLLALERSGSVGPGTGWLPRHLLVHEDDVLVAALVLYEKSDSYGEFVFDWGWADAALRAGIPYYPKLVAAIPFTPATGRRLLCLPNVPRNEVLGEISKALQQAVLAHGYSGVHILFCEPDEQALWQQHGFCARDSFQFHWQRAAHWQTFDDFLADLRAPSRKQVRKERARAREHGLQLRMRHAPSLSAHDVASLYALYRNTVWEKGAQAYLTPTFFSMLREQQGNHCWAATAEQGDQIVAMALFFASGTSLFGRYWGAAQAWDALHFELCYYLPIEWALGNGFTRFEAGAQGEHKLKRGLLPNRCYSAHKLAHPGLHAAVSQFVQQEARGVASCMAEYAEHTPYARNKTI